MNHGNQHLQVNMNKLKGKPVCLSGPHYSFPHDDNNSASSFSPSLFLFGLVLGFAGGGYKNRGQMREDREINRTRVHDVKSTRNQ